MPGDYHDLLDATIPSQPPPRHDVDMLIGRSRARLRRRRWLSVCSLGLVVLAIAAMLGPNGLLHLGRGDETGPGRPGVSAGTTPDPGYPRTTPTPTRPRPTLAGVPPTEAPEAARVRLSAAMKAVVRDKVPSAVLGGEFTVSHGFQESELTSDGEWMAPIYSFGGSQPVTVGPRRGQIGISLHRRLSSYACRSQPSPQQVSCTQSAGPHGELVIVQHLRDGAGADAQNSVIVRVERADGSAVWAWSSNVKEVFTAPPSPYRNPEVYPGRPPLNVEQLTAIALDPRLTIYP